MLLPGEGGEIDGEDKDDENDDENDDSDCDNEDGDGNVSRSICVRKPYLPIVTIGQVYNCKDKALLFQTNWSRCVNLFNAFQILKPSEKKAKYQYQGINR